MLVTQSLVVFAILAGPVLLHVTLAESPQQYIKHCQELGKSLGGTAMEEGCREVRVKCMNFAETRERKQGKQETTSPQRNMDEGLEVDMSLAAQLEERVLMAVCDSTLANACMAAATGAMFNGQDEICREAFTKGPDPDAKDSCPDLWTVLQVFHEASMKACKTVTPIRADFSGGKSGDGTHD